MTQARDPSVVTCYYRNPLTGRTTKYELPSIVYEEASRGRFVENRFVVPEDADAWSREEPEGLIPSELDDRTPKPYEAMTRPSQPPPAVATRSPEILRGRENNPVPPVPPQRSRTRGM